MAEKITQNKYTGVIRPELKIISYSTNPAGTLYTVWHGSRNNKSVDCRKIQEAYDYLREFKTKDDVVLDGLAKMHFSRILDIDIEPENIVTHNELANKVENLIKQSLRANLPASECVYFTIQVDNANVAWREQLVRSKFASYFMQTSRIYNMESMDVAMNESIEVLGGDKAVEVYKNTVDTIRNAYELLKELGVPQEDIRLQPQMFIHRVYWMVSLRTLVTVMSHRSDWIAQTTLWSPIIADLCKELRRIGLWDIVSEFIGHPPVVVNKVDGQYKVTKYYNLADNEARFRGDDPAIPDPLWLAYTGNKMPDFVSKKYYYYLKSLFINIWDDKYLDVLGWNRDHPEILGYYDPK